MLLRRTAPEESIVGIVLAGVSPIVMPWLGFAKKKLYLRYNQKQRCLRHLLLLNHPYPLGNVLLYDPFFHELK